MIRLPKLLNEAQFAHKQSGKQFSILLCKFIITNITPIPFRMA